jgi:hypothetical protein
MNIRELRKKSGKIGKLEKHNWKKYPHQCVLNIFFRLEGTHGVCSYIIPNWLWNMSNLGIALQTLVKCALGCACSDVNSLSSPVFCCPLSWGCRLIILSKFKHCIDLFFPKLQTIRKQSKLENSRYNWSVMSCDVIASSFVVFLGVSWQNMCDLSKSKVKLHYWKYFTAIDLHVSFLWSW